MRFHVVGVAAAIVATMVAGCGSDASVHGGGATETDNSIHILATNAQGSPIAGARVLLVRTDTWLRDVANTGEPVTLAFKADVLGRLRLDSLPTGEWSAQLETATQACSAPLKRDSSTMALRLQPLSKVGVKNANQPGAVLLAVGTSWSASTDPDGRAFLLLPPGKHALVARLDSGLATAGVVSVTVGSRIDTSVTINPRHILLDDFSSGDVRTTLSLYTGVGDWFVNEWGTHVYSDAHPDGASFDGAFSMRYTSADTNNSALAGIVFGDNGGFRPLNFSAMDSICFDLRGNGWVDLYFIEYAADRSWKMSANFRLDGISNLWTHRCVDAGSMQDHWGEVKSKTNTIAFLARRGDRLEVRKLELWGIPIDALIP